MQLVITLAIQISLMLVGILISIFIGVKNKLEIIGLSYLLGSGFVTILFLILHWFFNFKLDQLNFLFSLGIGILGPLIILTYLNKIQFIKELFQFNLRHYFKKSSKIERSILAIILILVAYGFFENYFWPIIDWDALAFYDFRSRVISLNKDMIEGIKLEYFFQYPPYTSFLHVFGYIFGATRVKVAYSFISVSLILSFFNLVRRKQNRLISLFFTLILSSSPMIFEHSTMAYTNLSYTTFFSIGLIYLWFYNKKGIVKDLIVGSLLIGFSTWIRSTEPFWISGLILIIISIIKHKKNFIISLFSIIFLSLPNKLWRFFLVDLNTVSKIEIIDTQSHAIVAIKDFLSQNQSFLIMIIRTLEVFKYLLTTLAPEFISLTILLILTFLNGIKNKYIEILTLVSLFIIIYGGTLIFSFTFETWDLIGGSIVRMSMIFIPLMLYIIAKDLKYEKKD
jgi:hypothetical protein